MKILSTNINYHIGNNLYRPLLYEVNFYYSIIERNDMYDSLSWLSESININITWSDFD